MGRHSDNGSCSATPASRFHAVIEASPQGYVLRDLDSSNGTYPTTNSASGPC